jgi:hypothetical protein
VRGAEEKKRWPGRRRLCLTRAVKMSVSQRAVTGLSVAMASTCPLTLPYVHGN